MATSAERMRALRERRRRGLAASSDDRVSPATRWLGCGGPARIKPAIRRIYQGAVVPEGEEFYPKEHNPMRVINQGPRTPGTLGSWSR
jgi:hypothetical protein